MNGETEQEKRERLAEERGARRALVNSRLDGHDTAINETRKQVQLNTNAIIDLNTNNVRALSELRHDLSDVKSDLHAVEDKVDELAGKPVAENRAWKRGVWQGVTVGLAIVIGTALSYVAIGVGHL